MVDLHCHILPGLDDGAQTLEAAVEMARVAEGGGIRTVVCTPHIRDDHAFAFELIDDRLQALRMALEAAEIDVEVRGGGEVSLAKLSELDDDALRAVCLGPEPYVLVESPYTLAPPLLEHALFELQLRGFRPILAHPERSPTFLRDPDRLARLVEGGILCSVTAMSISGKFGRTVQDFSLKLFADGLAHNIASDAHDATRRAPGFGPALHTLSRALGADRASLEWFVRETGSAVVDGRELPAGPPALRQPSGWKRMRQRVRAA